MTRNQKIKLLQFLRDGKLTVEILQPSQRYVFHEVSPGIYKMNDKEYTENEYVEFCEKIERKNKNILSWFDSKDRYDQDIIFTFLLPGSGDRANLTMKL